MSQLLHLRKYRTRRNSVDLTFSSIFSLHQAYLTSQTCVFDNYRKTRGKPRAFGNLQMIMRDLL